METNSIDVELTKIDDKPLTNIDPDDVHKTAIRRGKVRELVRMGYEPHQISLILSKGIVVGDQTIKVDCSEHIIRGDMEYIRQEDVAAAGSAGFPEKKAEVIDKLRFLYNQAVREYLSAKGAIRNSFLNTALNVLSKITDIEGIKAAEGLDIDLHGESRIASLAVQVQKLDEDDRSLILTAVRKVLAKGGQEGTGDVRVPGEPPAVSAQTSNDQGVSGKS